MPRERTATSKLADQQLDAGARESARYIDLCLDFFDDATGEWFASFGGRWDRLEKKYDGEAERGLRLKFHAGQIDAARWFEAWVAGYQADDFGGEPRIFDAVMYGGRRGGKSNLGWAALVAFAISVPGSICFVVVASESFYGEPATELEALMPREWYEAVGDPPMYLFPNGSRIEIRSGHVPRLLKQGRVDFVVIHEGQAQAKQAYDTISASIVDTGGLIMTTCNPPDVGDPGDWVAEVVAKIDRGDMVHGKAWFFDPELNPYINHESLHALAEKYDAHTYDVQVRGMFLLTPDTVLHSWDRKSNELKVPTLGDCTKEFTRHFEGTELDHIVGIDVQSYPWIAGVVFKAFRNPIAPDDMEQALLWGVGEAFVDKGDEVDCCSQLFDLGCDPKKTLVIMDASCDWQQAQRDQDKQRTRYRGKGAMDMFRGEGFVHVVPPDHASDANPEIKERARAANSRIGTKAGQRRFFVDPSRCPLTVESIRKWKTRPNGAPSRSAKWAHGGDAMTYVIWRFFPRRIEKRSVEVNTSLPRRFEGRDRMKGW